MWEAKGLRCASRCDCVIMEKGLFGLYGEANEFRASKWVEA